MEISLIKPSDSKEFVNFYKKLTGESRFLMFSPTETEERAEQEEEFIKKYDAYKHVFLARKDNKIVGYLGIGRSHLSKISHSAKFTVGVLAEHQRQKIATKLIEYAQDWAKEHGITRMELTVVTANEPAIALFKSTGFAEEGRKKKAVKLNGEYVDELLMAKLF